MFERKCIVTMKAADNANTREYTNRVHAASAYLRQILHSKSCHGCCDEPQKALCLRTSLILRHIDTCHDAHCLKSGCQTTKKLINHFDKCRRSSSLCLICFIASSDKEFPFSAASCKCRNLMCMENFSANSIDFKESKTDGYSVLNSASNECDCSPPLATTSPSSTLSYQCENELCYSKVPFQKHRECNHVNAHNHSRAI